MATIAKTPDEVSEWLKNQDWIKKFARTMRDTHTSRKTAVEILEGKLGVLSIAAAFNWADSPQGKEYWHRKHKELMEWYYG